MKKRIKVVITSGYRWSYFQWFILGFYYLEKNGKISLKFELPIGSMILAKTSNRILIRLADKIRKNLENDSYNMNGYILYYKDGREYKKKFAIDSADAPYLFSGEDLNNVDTYFKMQYPKDINQEGFSLTDKITIPWCDHAHVDSKLKLTDRGERKVLHNIDKRKIKPLMIGPRQLGNGLSYSGLKKGYDNYINGRSLDKEKEIMCYFGNALGPKKENVEIPDFDWEGDILGYYNNIVSHPNEKRAIVSNYLRGKEQCDARLISNSNADSGEGDDRSLIIPLKDFCKHVGKFRYNFNVSGYRLSIPNRFIESFMVGTGIITDKLYVKWYKPFGDEVFETIDMGYRLIEDVDWRTFKNDIENIPRITAQEVVNSYNNKWKPDVVAKYIINTIAESEII